MEKKYTLLVAILGMMIHSGVFAQDTACPPDLVHYWKFDENDSLKFTDHIGGLDALVVDRTTADSGVVGLGQIFNESKLTLPNPESFNWEANSSFTIEVWLNKSSTCPSPFAVHNGVIIGRDADSSDVHWWLGVSCSNPGKINFSLYSTDFNGVALESKTGIIDGQWHHVAVVRDGEASTTSILIDGKVDTTVSFTYTEGFSAIDSVNVGWLNLHKYYHYNGRLDELAVYSAALDHSVLMSHYNSRQPYCSDFPTDTTGTDTTIVDSSYSITLNFSGMTPVRGRSMVVYLNNPDNGATLDSLRIDSVDSTDFSVEFDSLFNESDYNLDIWADMDSNNVYDVPPVDHAWRIELLDVSSDTTVLFTYNNDFTDIFDDGSDTTIVDTGNYQLTVVFSGFEDNVGQYLVVYLRDPATSDFIDSVVVSAIDSSDFEVVFDSVTVRDAYNIDFYTDVNGNGIYDIPPIDHAWRIEVVDVNVDTVINFVFDTIYTDIGLVVTRIDNKSTPGFTVYPNPSRDELSISLDESATELAVLSVSGSVVLHRTVNASDRLIKMNVSALKPGIYILKVTTPSGQGYLKFLKQ